MQDRQTGHGVQRAGASSGRDWQPKRIHKHGFLPLRTVYPALFAGPAANPARGGFLCGIKALKRFHSKPPPCPMVEMLSLLRPSFNKSLRIESRPERLTAEPGAVLLREIMERTQITEWLAGRVCDPRQVDRVIYPLADLLRTCPWRIRTHAATGSSKRPPQCFSQVKLRSAAGCVTTLPLLSAGRPFR